MCDEKYTIKKEKTAKFKFMIDKI